MNPWAKLWLLLGALGVSAAIAIGRPAAAQDPAPIRLASADELAEIVGPIALYPDDLVGIVLPASTYPLQVVEAARFLDARTRDASLTPDEDWDDSVVALLNYPQVVELMNDDLDWTYDLGTAVLNQRADVLDAIQDFRDRAYSAGNLRSDDHQLVTQDDGAIAIRPADPQVIYVPYYEPERVVVYQSVPVYHYYPWRYPVYYYPYPASYAFDTGFFWGVRSWFSIGWHSHYVHVYDYGYNLHPYYGWRYYEPFYVRNVYLNVNVNRGYAWEPRNRYGGRPVVRGYEGRVYTSNEPPRVSRGVAGAAARDGTVRTRTTANTNTGQVSRGVAGGAYRNRSVESPARAQQSTTNSTIGSVAAPSRTAPQRAPATTNGGTYRSNGGGMSQARVTDRAAPQQSRQVQAQPSTRGSALGGSTGMPQQSSRSTITRSAPPAATAPSRAPSGGGMAQAQRSTSPSPSSDRGGSYRSSNGGGGGSYRGGNSGGNGGGARSSNGGGNRGGGNARGGERSAAR